ncbi:MAG TPA: hypothetical protein VNZ22_12910, partial [Bacillota bacterium]|nr:hypothetical protein [Bacillota bacterium]
YRDGVRLPNAIDPGSYLFDYNVEFSSVSPTLLYCAYPSGGFRRIRVDANGATLLEELGGLINGFDRDMRCDAGWVFTAGGRVFDPEAKTNIATVPYGGLVAPDSRSGKVFYLTGSGATYNLVCLNFTNLSLVGTVTITNVSGTPTSLVRWGNDGLAFRTTGNQVFLLRTTMADDRDQDGLADSWELQHFGSLNAAGGGPNEDPDHDGFTNLQEQQLGLDPLAFDALRFQQYGTLPDGTFQLAVFGPPNVPFALMSTTDLTNWSTLLTFTCTNVPTVLRDATSTNFAQRYYKIVPAR